MRATSNECTAVKLPVGSNEHKNYRQVTVLGGGHPRAVPLDPMPYPPHSLQAAHDSSCLEVVVLLGFCEMNESQSPLFRCLSICRLHNRQEHARMAKFTAGEEVDVEISGDEGDGDYQVREAAV